MLTDIECYISLVVAILGILGSAFTLKQKSDMAANFLEFAKDLSDLLALVYATGNAGTIGEAENVKKIVGKVEEIWQDLEALGPAFQKVLEQKSAIAEAVANYQSGDGNK